MFQFYSKYLKIYSFSRPKDDKYILPLSFTFKDMYDEYHKAETNYLQEYSP